MAHKLKDLEGQFLVACNPLKNVWHKVSGGLTCSTGQPLVIFGNSRSALYDLLFESYPEEVEGPFEQVDEEGVEIPYVPREVLWSVGYTEETYAPVLAALAATLPNVRINPVKHPLRDEYALPWSEPIINTMPSSDTKTVIVDAHLDSVNAGTVLTTEQMLADGWVTAAP